MPSDELHQKTREKELEFGKCDTSHLTYTENHDGQLQYTDTSGLEAEKKTGDAV